MENKEKELERILTGLGSTLIAFSGGVDSSYLLYKAKGCLGGHLLAVTAALEVHTADERIKACRIAQMIGVEHLVIKARMLEENSFTANPPSRCYFCKRKLFRIFSQIASLKRLAGVCDGANADDRNSFRPGRRAADELQVRSPLGEAGLTKQEIRQLSKHAGLETWNLPAAPCLATRLPYGERITAEKLGMITAAEEFLRSLGFDGTLRVRYHKKLARIEVPPERLPAMITERETIAAYFRGLGFAYVTLDLQGFRSGSMDEPLEHLII